MEKLQIDSVELKKFWLKINSECDPAKLKIQIQEMIE